MAHDDRWWNDTPWHIRKNFQTSILQDERKLCLARCDLVSHDYTANPTYFRYILFMDKRKASVAAPAVGDVLEPSVTNLSFYNIAALTNSRFKILYDKIFSLDPWGGATGSFYTSKTFQNLQKKFKVNRYAGWDDNGVPYYNHIYQLLISNLSTAESPSFTSRIEVVYEDA